MSHFSIHTFFFFTNSDSSNWVPESSTQNQTATKMSDKNVIQTSHASLSGKVLQGLGGIRKSQCRAEAASHEREAIIGWPHRGNVAATKWGTLKKDAVGPTLFHIIIWYYIYIWYNMNPHSLWLGFDIKVVACRAPLAPLMPMQLWQNGNAVWAKVQA